MSNKLRFMYGGMPHLVQHSRQLPKELLKQSRGIGVQWDSWWSREMFGLDVAMLSPKRMLPLLNVWQEEGWGEEGVTHFVWQIMALKFWIRCSWWQLINYGSHILTTHDPFPGSFWRSVCGSNYEMTRVVMGSEGETCLSIFWLKTNYHKKYRKVSVHVFRTSQRCVYSSFPCKILVSFLVKMSIWLNNGFHLPVFLNLTHWLVPTGGNHPSLTTHSQSLGAQIFKGGCLWCEVSGPVGHLKKPSKIAQQKTVDSHQKDSKSLQISYPIFFGKKDNKNPHVLTFWGHQLLAQMLLWGAFEVNDILIRFIWSSTIRFW